MHAAFREMLTKIQAILLGRQNRVLGLGLGKFVRLGGSASASGTGRPGVSCLRGVFPGVCRQTLTFSQSMRTDYRAVTSICHVHTSACSRSVHTKHSLIFTSPIPVHKTSVRHASARRKDSRALEGIDEQREKKFGELTVGEKVARVGKDATYTGIIIVGVGVIGLMTYAIGRELFSGQSSSGVYGKAFKMCKKNQEVIDELGEPIKGYGEMNRRGRRRHVSHVEYLVDDVKHMRMKFYVEGPLRKGTVHLEVKKNENDKYEHRYLFVELDGYPSKTIVLEDNR